MFHIIIKLVLGRNAAGRTLALAFRGEKKSIAKSVSSPLSVVTDDQ